MAKGININEFKIFTEFLAKKDGRGNFPTPIQFNQLVNQALLEFIYKRNGNKMDYQNGRPIPKVSYEKTADVMDDLRYIKETRVFNVVNDQIGIPDGSTVKDINGAICPEYIHWKSLRHYYYEKVGTEIIRKEYEIVVVPEGELAKRLVSSVNIPTKMYPIAQIKSSTIRFWPKKLQYVEMDYTRYPVPAVWGYTMSGTPARPTYNPASSIDIELPKECMNELAVMYLSYLGINMRDAELLNYAEMSKQKGI